MKLIVKKLHPDAKLPAYAMEGDAGMDLTAISKEYNPYTNQVIFGTGLAFEIPDGHVGLLFPRSSIYKTGLSLSNSVGVLDAKYRGEVKAIFNVDDRPKKNYEIGDRICQLIVFPFPKMEVVEAQELSETERGSGGFGSTGK